MFRFPYAPTHQNGCKSDAMSWVVNAKILYSGRIGICFANWKGFNFNHSPQQNRIELNSKNMRIYRLKCIDATLLSVQTDNQKAVDCRYHISS
jgi:hypothetical protein